MALNCLENSCSYVTRKQRKGQTPAGRGDKIKRLVTLFVPLEQSGNPVSRGHHAGATFRCDGPRSTYCNGGAAERAAAYICFGAAELLHKS